MSLRRNALFAIVLTALSAIVGEWSGIAGAERFWCLPAGLLLLALAYDALLARRARVTLAVRAPSRWRLARPVEVVLEVAQSGSRSLEFELAPDAPAGVACRRELARGGLEPEQRIRLPLRAVARRLGPRVWPPMRARIAGPLKLAWWRQSLSDPAAIAVEPDLLGDAAGLRGAERIGERASQRRGSGGEVLQLRPYAAGDALRSIDWKASARVRRLIARDFSEDQHLEIVVGIDVGRSSSIWCGDLDRLGHYVNLTARLAERATALDDRVGLVIYGDRPLAALPPGRGMTAVRRIRALLSSLETQPTDSNPMHAAARIRSLVRRRCLVILLTEIDDAATGSQLLGAVRLLRPMHLPLVVGLKSEALDAFARVPTRDWLDPYRGLAVEESRQRQARSIGALGALGVVALVARPEQLEAEVFEAYARFRRERRV